MEEGVICLAVLVRRCELVVVLPSFTAEGKFRGGEVGEWWIFGNSIR